MKRVILKTALAIVATTAAAQAEDYKIVILQSQTGAAAFIGAPLSEGARLAADELNEAGFFGEGNKLVYEAADDATDRTQTMSLMTRYTADPDVLTIMGPTSSAVAGSAAQMAQERETHLFATGNSTEVLDAGKWGSIFTQPYYVTTPAIGDYAIETLGVTKCVTIGIKEVEAYVALTRDFEEYMTENGVELLSSEGVSVNDSDFSSLATKLAGGDQDCIYISAPGAQGGNIVLQLKQAGLDPSVKIMGHTAFASAAYVEKGGGAVEGTYLMSDWVPGGSSEMGKEFAAHYQETYGKEADNWAAIGYSAMHVLANAMKAAGPNPTRESFNAAVNDVRDVEIVIGDLSFSYDDERVPHYGMNVLTVEDGEFVLAPK
ncbi:ABC transporter substrate-binding protein [Palleronia abyssalis]|uniref:Leu/Ile/Val-binding protein n=1 Tax=Palleronia abyssalis TaxID=1501240 RepID=A0A2R8BZ85_9RHOB|nr:ABC transporter substrate-binding protein [Palleronia abyssalis]SPJ25406.1 Leu/Ile/Val-binding protein [Palleronia abyssalis]